MKKSTDVWFCAFLTLSGYPVAHFEVVARGRVECHFKIDDEAWKALKISFNNSEVIKFKGAVEQIKDLAF